MKKQQGFSPIIILVALAVISTIAIISYGAFILTQTSKPSPTPISVTQSTKPLEAPLGTPECPELDYTGCDTSGDFATWDGE